MTCAALANPVLRLVSILAVVALALLASACGDDSPDAAPAEPLASADKPTPTPAQPQAAAQTPAPWLPTRIPHVATPTPTPASWLPTRIPHTAVPTPTTTPAPWLPRRIPHTPTPTPTAQQSDADGYLVSVPSEMRSELVENVAVSLFAGESPAEGAVSVELIRASDGATVASATEFVRGSDAVPLDLSQVAPGGYTLSVRADNFSDSAPLQVVDGTLIFVETDKPIYKPGQDVRVRALRLSADLKPLPGEVEIEIQDAKGTRVFRRQARADAFGMASASMPLSAEPNLGVWKVAARYGDRVAQTDIRVERYALPKYEITIDTPKDWALADERIAGSVSAEYSFGKPVRGEVEIVASRYVGVWEEFARFTAEIDGDAAFDLPPAEYVAGVPENEGRGNLIINATVREKATGYAESATRLLAVASSPVNLRLIPESQTFKPGLPFSFLLLAESPDNAPLDLDGVTISIAYQDESSYTTHRETQSVRVKRGRAMATITPPEDALSAEIRAIYEILPPGANPQTVGHRIDINAGHSPSGNFIHLTQTGNPDLSVGDAARFRVHSTARGGAFYYEIVSRGKTVFADMSGSPDIEFIVTPAMAPSSRLVAYKILPDGEVAADYIPFAAAGRYPMQTSISLSADEVRPGDPVRIDLAAQGVARVGLAAVDRSVFILAENRLNLAQVFAEIERIYMQPQAEAHYGGGSRRWTEWARGASEVFAEAGLTVMTNKTLPQGEVIAEFHIMMSVAAESEESADDAANLAQVSRVRQFFPETWLWTDALTDADGKATISAESPDSITTWKLRAVALSTDHGLGIAEADLRVFQPFFLSVDLPYSAVRGERFPVRVALYNYTDSDQEFRVELENSDAFELMDEPAKTVFVASNDLGGAEFDIRLTALGPVPLRVSARGADFADAVIKNILVEPEGVRREMVENLILSPGDELEIPAAAPAIAVPGSQRTTVALSGSYLSQTIDGLENLLRMPFGCGEQNMILFAPNVFVARYLRETGQSKPEIMAKAERLMMTGYQRELIYRRADGSFSAFGDSDESGSLWLTAFVLKTFAQADGLIYMDDAVLRDAARWILDHQKPDGSFAPVGFLHHQELLGGLQGNAALTAYVATALTESGKLLYAPDDLVGAANAISYLENELDAMDDAYTLALSSYALALADSPRADAAIARLMDMSRSDADGLYWSAPLPETYYGAGSADVETTGYALLALLETGDRVSASSAARWLVSQRNALGGFGSTQDTVVGLQALIRSAAADRANADATVALTTPGGWSREIRIDADNADVTQIIETPRGEPVRIAVNGNGEVVAQFVSLFNIPEVAQPRVDAFSIEVDYDATDVAVDDRIAITAAIRFTPPVPASAGMVVVDIAIPTGFSPAAETVAALVENRPNIKRREIAGRKVIFYIEDMKPNETVRLTFAAIAQHPVRAQPVASAVYAYYTPAWRAETLSAELTAE